MEPTEAAELTVAHELDPLPLVLFCVTCSGSRLTELTELTKAAELAVAQTRHSLLLVLSVSVEAV